MSKPDPCTEEAIEQGCTCRVPMATAYDIDPPEPRRDKHCPLHGWARDPDDEYERQRDEPPSSSPIFDSMTPAQQRHCEFMGFDPDCPDRPLD